MNKLKYFFALLAIVCSTNACQKFEDLEADPNRSTSVPPSLVLRGVLKDMYVAPWGDASKWCQYWCVNYNYYGNNEYWSGPTSLKFSSLKNVIKMEEEAAKILPAQNAYSALGKFFRAYFYYDMTMKVGDLPLSEALKGAENIAPKYDTQKEVFKSILKWLEDANTELSARIAAADNTLQGDFYYGGNLRKWQKAVNAFHLRVLVQLSKKATDADLNVKGEFARILGDPTKYPLMESLGDDLAYQYNSASDKYPTNPDNFGFDALRNNMAGTHIGLLTSLKDPRVFVVATPASAKIAAGLSETDFEAYIGAPSDQGLAEMTTAAQNGALSLISRTRYYASYNAEPGVQIGYAEMCLNIAEGLNAGWASGDAKSWYEKGVTASMNFFGISDLTAIDAYLRQAGTEYKGNNANGLKQIGEQRYLALFQQSGMESYYNWRRTSVPDFAEGGAGTGNSGIIPNRFKYPDSERINNNANYNAALERQFNGKIDDVNAKIWVIQ